MIIVATPSRRSLSFASLLAAFVVACTPPPYDDQTDKAISTLQSDVDTEIVSLLSFAHTASAGGSGASDAKTKGGYQANKTFYQKVDVELMSIKLRVDAAPSVSTSQMDKALEALRQNILSGPGSLQSVHQQEDLPGEAYFTTERTILAQQFQALLTYELLLKNGSASTNNTTTGTTPTPASAKK